VRVGDAERAAEGESRRDLEVLHKPLDGTLVRIRLDLPSYK
jgi:hypothetical protein